MGVLVSVQVWKCVSVCVDETMQINSTRITSRISIETRLGGRSIAHAWYAWRNMAKMPRINFEASADSQPHKHEHFASMTMSYELRLRRSDDIFWRVHLLLCLCSLLQASLKWEIAYIKSKSQQMNRGRIHTHTHTYTQTLSLSVPERDQHSSSLHRIRNGMYLQWLFVVQA